MMRLGVAGCGAMGLPMAEALAAAGLDTRGYDLVPRAGAVRLADWQSFCGEVETVISVVRDVPETEALLFGPDGLIANAPHLSRLVISSTVAPPYIHDLRKRLDQAVALIDAPMSGAPIGARERRLSFMLGGADADIAPLMPAFRAMGQEIRHLGPLGAGMTMKVLNNMVGAASVVATRLARDWAGAAGIDPAVVLSVLEASSGQTWVSRNYDRIEWIEEGFDPANTMGILAKDVTAALEAAPNGADKTLPETLIGLIQGLSPKD